MVEGAHEFVEMDVEAADALVEGVQVLDAVVLVELVDVVGVEQGSHDFGQLVQGAAQEGQCVRKQHHALPVQLTKGHRLHEVDH